MQSLLWKDQNLVLGLEGTFIGLDCVCRVSESTKRSADTDIKSNECYSKIKLIFQCCNFFASNCQVSLENMSLYRISHEEFLEYFLPYSLFGGKGEKYQGRSKRRANEDLHQNQSDGQ